VFVLFTYYQTIQIHTLITIIKIKSNLRYFLVSFPWYSVGIIFYLCLCICKYIYVYIYLFVYLDICSLRRTLGINAFSICYDDHGNDAMYPLLSC